MKPYEQPRNSVNTLEQLERVRMIPSDRRRAKAYLRQAELFADTLVRADAQLRHAFGFVGRGILALVHRRKVHTL